MEIEWKEQISYWYSIRPEAVNILEKDHIYEVDNYACFYMPDEDVEDVDNFSNKIVIGFFDFSVEKSRCFVLPKSNWHHELEKTHIREMNYDKEKALSIAMNLMFKDSYHITNNQQFVIAEIF